MGWSQEDVDSSLLRLKENKFFRQGRYSYIRCVTPFDNPNIMLSTWFIFLSIDQNTKITYTIYDSDDCVLFYNVDIIELHGSCLRLLIDEFFNYVNKFMGCTLLI